MPRLRKWSRFIHRDLSFFFSGVIIIYAVSGIMLNHKKDFNTDYSVTRKDFVIPGRFPVSQQEMTKPEVIGWLKLVGEEDRYTKHYFPAPGQMKVFIKGGSSLVVNLENGQALYESLRKRHIVSAFNRLHYNPGRWWTVFSDIFAVSLLMITLTGIIMLKGNKGFFGRGGIELLIGMLIPLSFIFFF